MNLLTSDHENILDLCLPINDSIMTDGLMQIYPLGGSHILYVSSSLLFDLASNSRILKHG
jgi:hypothetical protein